MGTTTVTLSDLTVATAGKITSSQLGDYVDAARDGATMARRTNFGTALVYGRGVDLLPQVDGAPQKKALAAWRKEFGTKVGVTKGYVSQLSAWNALAHRGISPHHKADEARWTWAVQSSNVGKARTIAEDSTLVTVADVRKAIDAAMTGTTAKGADKRSTDAGDTGDGESVNGTATIDADNSVVNRFESVAAEVLRQVKSLSKTEREDAYLAALLVLQEIAAADATVLDRVKAKAA